jgi:hypothetical protein
MTTAASAAPYGASSLELQLLEDRITVRVSYRGPNTIAHLKEMAAGKFGAFSTPINDAHFPQREEGDLDRVFRFGVFDPTKSVSREAVMQVFGSFRFDDRRSVRAAGPAEVIAFGSCMAGASWRRAFCASAHGRAWCQSLGREEKRPPPIIGLGQTWEGQGGLCAAFLDSDESDPHLRLFDVKHPLDGEWVYLLVEETVQE